MAKTFAILSAIILLISAFIANKNQALYVDAIGKRQKQEAVKVQRSAELKTLEGEVAVETTTLAEVKADLAQREEAVAGQAQKNTELSAEVATKKAEVASREAQVAEAEKSVGNVEELKEMLTKLKAQRVELATLEEEIDTNNASLSNLTAENKRLDGVVAELREQTSWPIRKVSNPKLRTTVSAAYPTWGFVTLSSGENAGVIAGSILEVKRDDATVARLLVTAVESSTAAADIIPEVANGPQTALSIGDLVVAAAPTKEGVIRPSSTTKPELPTGDLPSAPPLEGSTPAGDTPAAEAGDAPAAEAEAPAAPAVTDDPFADFATPAGN
jgi:predicted RNase H-like nuclease (RuvC/YqgF family)